MQLTHDRKVEAASAVALAASALAPTFAVLLVALAAVGLTTVVGQILTPLAGDLATDEQRGRVVGTVASGLLIGILSSRTISGVAADAFGWRAIYVAAAVVALLLAFVLALLAVVLLDVAIQAVNVLNQTRLFAVDPMGRSRLNTAFVTSNFIGGAIGSTLAGMLWQHGRWSAVTAAGSALVGLALIVWFSQRRVLAPTPHTTTLLTASTDHQEDR